MSVSRLPDLVRAIRGVYAALAAKGETVPTLAYGKRYAGRDMGANTILLMRVDAGDVGGPLRTSAGYVASAPVALDAYIWSAEPTIADPVNADEIEMELARDDASDVMIDRYVNVIKALASGRSEGQSITINPPGVIMAHGEKAVVRYEYARGVEQDKAVYRLDIAAIANRNPDQPNGSTGKTFNVSVDMHNERP